MSDLAKTLATIDLPALNRAQLQMYCRLIREQSGADIRLNSTNEKLREAIVAYISEQATAAREAALQSEAEEIAAEAYRGCGIYIAPTEDGFTARIRDLDSEIDLTVKAPTKEEVRSAAIAAIDSAFNKMIEAEVTALESLPDFENGEPHVTTLADFEGIDAPLGDWWASCPLSCDPCNYQSCDLPPLQTQLPFVAEVVREGARKLLESLEKRSLGAMDEALMQEYIDRSGLFEELERAWHQIPDYKEFCEIFQQEAHIAMIMEILMTEEDHRRYVAVCKQALAVEQQFARKALLLLAR